MFIILTHEGCCSDHIEFTFVGPGFDITGDVTCTTPVISCANNIENWAEFESAWLYDDATVVVRHTSWDGTSTDTPWEDSAPRKCRLDDITQQLSDESAADTESERRSDIEASILREDSQSMRYPHAQGD
jgi:hypothetical protein